MKRNFLLFDFADRCAPSYSVIALTGSFLFPLSLQHLCVCDYLNCVDSLFFLYKHNPTGVRWFLLRFNFRVRVGHSTSTVSFVVMYAYPPPVCKLFVLFFSFGICIKKKKTNDWYVVYVFVYVCVRVCETTMMTPCFSFQNHLFVFCFSRRPPSFPVDQWKRSTERNDRNQDL